MPLSCYTLVKLGSSLLTSKLLRTRKEIRNIHLVPTNSLAVNHSLVIQLIAALVLRHHFNCTVRNRVLGHSPFIYSSCKIWSIHFSAVLFQNKLLMAISLSLTNYLWSGVFAKSDFNSVGLFAALIRDGGELHLFWWLQICLRKLQDLQGWSCQSVRLHVHIAGPPSQLVRAC